MPHLQSLWSEVSSKRNDVAFLAVNQGDSKDVISQWWNEAGFTLRAVRQDGFTTTKAFGVSAFPTNYVIGPDGKVIYRGISFDEEAIQQAIRSALASTTK
jgi:hypothetical protein